MKKNNVFIVLVIAVAVSVGIYFFFSKQSDRQGLKIAILVPAIHPAMDEIEQGIKDTMNKDGKQKYHFDVFNGNGNKTLIRSQAEEIISRKYDLVFSIGTGCSQLLAELTKKKESTLPVVFTAIDSDPVALGIVPSLESSGSNITGCIVKDDFAGQIDALLQLKPNVKQLLFVFDPSHGPAMNQKKNEIEVVLKDRSIALKTVEVFSTSEMTQKVAPNLNDVDVILIYTDHTVVSGMDAIITLANKYKVTLLASDLNSADKGAAIAYGVREYDHGACAAQKALLILDEYKLPRDIPITPVTNYRVKINTNTMKNQGLDLSQEQLDAVIQNRGLLTGKGV